MNEETGSRFLLFNIHDLISVGLNWYQNKQKKKVGWAVFFVFFSFPPSENLINCVIIRLLMRRQSSTWTSGQPAGNMAISLWWHQTSVQTDAKRPHYKPSRGFISEKYKQLFDCYWSPTGGACCGRCEHEDWQQIKRELLRSPVHINSL